MPLQSLQDRKIDTDLSALSAPTTQRSAPRLEAATRARRCISVYMSEPADRVAHFLIVRIFVLAREIDELVGPKAIERRWAPSTFSRTLTAGCPASGD